MSARTMTALSTLIAVLSLAGLSAQAATVPSKPQRAIVYRDGTAVLIESMDRTKARAEIELPAATDLSSVRVLDGGRSLGGLGIETLYEESQVVERSLVGGVAVEKSTLHRELVGYRLRIGPAGLLGKSPLVLRYAVSGLSWQPKVEAELLDGDRVAVALTAMVTNQALDLHGCQLQLASSAGQLPSKLDFAAHHGAADLTARAADLIYDAGVQTIPRGRVALLTVMAATGRYQRTHVWHTNTRERVQVLIGFTNPLPQPLCGAPAEIYRDGVLLDQDAVEWAPPGTRVQLAAGHSHEVELERAVDTVENVANKIRPFRHKIDFKVTNRGARAINLAVVFPKKMGSRHKTIYKFARQPDRRPGMLYVWDLDLKAGQDQKIAFHLDSEYPRFGDYNAYESARHAL